MKRWISSILFAFLATVVATWMAIASEPVEQAPVRLLAPIPIEDDESNTPESERLKVEVVHSESHGFPRARSSSATPSSAPPSTPSSPGAPAREPLFAHLYHNWGKPKPARGPSASETHVPLETETETHGASPNEQIAKTELDRLREQYVRPRYSSERAIVQLPGRDTSGSDTDATQANLAMQVAASTSRDVPRFNEKFDLRDSAGQPLGSESTLGDVPRDSTLWWEIQMDQRMRRNQQPLPLNVDVLTVGALEHTPQIESLTSLEELRDSYFDQTPSNVDWRALWNAKSDKHVSAPPATPVAQAKCLRDVIWNRYLGRAPRDATANDEKSTVSNDGEEHSIRFVLSGTQPLLDELGQAYSHDRIVYLKLRQDLSADDLNEQMSNVVEAYWNMYAARSVCLQQHKLFGDAEHVIAALNRQQDIGLGNRQLLRAETAVADRRSKLIRAETELRNAESRLCTLVNDARLTQLGPLELIPLEAPTRHAVSLSLKETLQSAVVHRTEILLAIAQFRESAAEQGIDEKELLPELEQVISSQIAELCSGMGGSSPSQGDLSRHASAASNEPESAVGHLPVGLVFDRKHRNVASAMQEFRTTLCAELTKVADLVRESDTSYQEMVNRYGVLKAAHVEADYLENQLRFQPGTAEAAVSLLNDLLRAQECRADAESRFVESQVVYVLSFTHAKRAAGILIYEFADNQDG
ncbi:MAG: TolC family protein [Planctomycetaceae bacterium]